MKLSAIAFYCLAVSMCCFPLNAQTQAPAATVVPRLVNFSGRATNERGNVIAGSAGVTFAIYKEQYEGVPLWLETQNVQADGKGNYTVQLGATKSDGLPLELFSSGEARWLGVRVNDGEEQPRVFLLSVPYALKAADAQTLGGLPPSAFVLAAPSDGNAATASPAPSPQDITPPVGGAGTQNYIPLWTDNTGDLGNSILYQTGSGSTAKIGINEKSPIFTLDVNGQELVRGLMEMATTNYATPTRAYNSQPFNLESSAYNSGTAKYTLNHFQWQAEPTGNNTTTPAATLNLLYGTDPALPAETGLKLSNTGVFTFAPGQLFPGTGTISGVTAGTGMTGGGASGNVTLNVDSTKVAFLNVANKFTKAVSVTTKFGSTPVTAQSPYTAIIATMTGDFNGVAAIEGMATSTGGNDSTYGVYGSSSSDRGIGVFGTTNGATGSGVFGQGAVFGSTGVTGENGTSEGGVGVYGFSSGNGIGVHGNSPNGTGVFGESTSAAGIVGQSTSSSGIAGSTSTGQAGVFGYGPNTVGVYGSSSGGFGFATDSNVQQARSGGGWVKAMIYVNGLTPPYTIVRCFNSTLTGAAATTPPCGFNLQELGQGIFVNDFGFEVDDRFILGQLRGFDGDGLTALNIANGSGDANQAVTECYTGNGGYTPCNYYLFVF